MRARRRRRARRMRVRRDGARRLMLLAFLGIAALLFATTAGSAAATPGATSGAGRAHTSRGLEVDVMNEPVRGGEPELAIDPLHPQDLVLGHTVVGNSYSNPGNALAAVD